MIETKPHALAWILALAGSATACDVESRPIDEKSESPEGSTAAETTDETSSGRPIAEGESSSTSSGPVDPSTTGSPETTGAPTDVCPSLALEDPLPATVAVDFSGADVFNCGGEGNTGPDVSIVWTAPSDGLFSVQTAETDFQHTSFVLRGDCTGAADLCQGDLEEYLFTDQTWFPALQGETVTIVLQAENGDVGQYNFELREEECPNEIVDASLPVQLTRTADTQTMPVQFGPECGSGFEGGGLHFYEWTADADGSYRIVATGAFSELEVRDTTCYGAPLGCSTHPQRETEPDAAVEVDLIAGQTVVAVVAGYGEFVLSISDAG